jgi:hypothetical protein
MQVNTKGKVLSVFTLMMINVIAVDSLRTLPISAEYGSSLIFYYVVAAVCFFIPTALVTAELATGWPNTGGAYVGDKSLWSENWIFNDLVTVDLQRCVVPNNIGFFSRYFRRIN